jgi:hypothetical protein
MKYVKYINLDCGSCVECCINFIGEGKGDAMRLQVRFFYRVYVIL